MRALDAVALGLLRLLAQLGLEQGSAPHAASGKHRQPEEEHDPEKIPEPLEPDLDPEDHGKAGEHHQERVAQRRASE